jgi:PAS domain S-box-containing protein
VIPERVPHRGQRSTDAILETGVEDAYRLLVDAVSDYAIFHLDPEGRVASWNTGAQRLKGYRADEIIGKSFEVFYPPEDVAAGKCALELVEAARVGRFEDEGWRVRKDGTLFWANVVISAIRDARGRLLGYAKVTRDLTARKRAEDAVRESEERFRLLVASVTDYAIFMLDTEGRVASWNAGAERINGYTADEIMGRPLSVFYPPEDMAAGKARRELEIARETGRYEEEGWRVRKDGTRFYANVVVTALRGPKGELRGFAKVTRDVSERKRAEEQAGQLRAEREARLALEAANAARSAFLSMFAHELRTPLTALRMYVGAMRKKNDTGQRIEPELFIRLDSQIARFSKLVADVGDSALVESGRGLDLRLADEDLAAIVRESVAFHAVSLTARAAARHRIELHAEARPFPIAGDRVRLEQVLSNLFENAVKYSPDGGVIEVRVEPAGDSSYELSVRDPGIGIPAEDLAQVTDRYFRASNVPDRNFPGLGLGLSISREIIARHGGTLTIESDLGKGTVVRIRLPAKKA